MTLEELIAHCGGCVELSRGGRTARILAMPGLRWRAIGRRKRFAHEGEIEESDALQDVVNATAIFLEIPVCDFCGNPDMSVTRREIHDDDTLHNICDACYQERKDDI